MLLFGQESLKLLSTATNTRPVVTWRPLVSLKAKNFVSNPKSRTSKLRISHFRSWCSLFQRKVRFFKGRSQCLENEIKKIETYLQTFGSRIWSSQTDPSFSSILINRFHLMLWAEYLLEDPFNLIFQKLVKVAFESAKESASYWIARRSFRTFGTWLALRTHVAWLTSFVNFPFQIYFQRLYLTFFSLRTLRTLRKWSLIHVNE